MHVSVHAGMYMLHIMSVVPTNPCLVLSVYLTIDTLNYFDLTNRNIAPIDKYVKWVHMYIYTYYYVGMSVVTPCIMFMCMFVSQSYGGQ